MHTLVPPPVIAIITGLAMYFVDRKTPWGKIESAWQTPLAMVLLMLGLVVMLVAAMSFLRARTTINPMRPMRASRLMTTGIYRISRNPIYLADVLMLAAVAVWFGNAFNVVLLAAFVWYIQRFQILPEERALAKLFGADYTAYCVRVRRWL
jgi:protein-S-isoprenylcysteine O-methyltransferase Ste14